MSIEIGAQGSSYASTSETNLGEQSSLSGSPVQLPFWGVQDYYHSWLKAYGGTLFEDDSGYYTDTWVWKFQWVPDLPGDQPPTGELNATGYNAVFISSGGSCSSPVSAPQVAGNGTISFAVLPTTTAPQCVMNQQVQGVNAIAGSLDWAAGTLSAPVYNFQKSLFGGTSSIVNDNGTYTIAFTGSYGTSCSDWLNFTGPSFGLQEKTSTNINYLWTISSIAGLSVTYS
ncbi:MAG: hypothetical protein ACYC96_08605 [Fimbriimonadaceae bacterium]